ncbi:MAG: hypothetical protein EDX89_22595 [Acidobacteria bacterium]|nr:MAG: hypothetical protein EDX89_22595 [Acidobacteriota bacterium]
MRERPKGVPTAMATFAGRVRVLALACCSLIPAVGAAGPPQGYDDCDAGFIAFVGASTYQFSPSHEGDLGHVRLYTILSYQRAAAFEDFGRAIWRLGATRNYTTDNVNSLAQTPGAINPGQTNGL